MSTRRKKIIKGGRGKAKHKKKKENVEHGDDELETTVKGEAGRQSPGLEPVQYKPRKKYPWSHKCLEDISLVSLTVRVSTFSVQSNARRRSLHFCFKESCSPESCHIQLAKRDVKTIT